MMTGIILAAVIVGGTGLFIGLFLAFAGTKFAVEVDERIITYCNRFSACK